MFRRESREIVDGTRNMSRRRPGTAFPGMPTPSQLRHPTSSFLPEGTKPVRVPDQLWRSWLDDTTVVTLRGSKRDQWGGKRCVP